MTREEARLILQENAQLLHFEHPHLGLREAIGVAIKALSQPSLPSDLDEAAEEYVKTTAVKVWGKIDPQKDLEGYMARANYGTGLLDGFKAGAEWMAGKYEKIEGELVDWYSTSDGKDYCCGIKTDEAFEIPEGFYIRKK